MHDKQEEGLFVKEDYEGAGRVLRFRNKMTEKYIDELLYANGFEVEERFVKEEADRDKRWMVNICKKKPLRIPVKTFDNGKIQNQLPSPESHRKND